MWSNETWLCNAHDCRFKLRNGACSILIEIEVDRPNGRMRKRCSFYKPRIPYEEFEVIRGVRVIRDSHSLVYIEEVKK